MMVFQGFPGGAQILRPPQLRGTFCSSWAVRLVLQNILAVKYKLQDSKLQTYRIRKYYKAVNLQFASLDSITRL